MKTRKDYSRVLSLRGIFDSIKIFFVGKMVKYLRKCRMSFSL